jgi:hypothetical protein
MPNALGNQGPTFAQAAPDTGGIPGGIVPVSPGAQGNALGAPPAAPTAGLGNPGAAPQGQQQPAPTHEQTVAALHHTAEVTHQLMTLMKDPDLGKKDARSQIVDASLELVQKGLTTVPAIVEQIKTVPQDPQGQLNWVKGHLLANQLAQFAVLEHYRQGNPPTFDAAGDTARSQQLYSGKRKGHMDIMKGLVSHYRGPR